MSQKKWQICGASRLHILCHSANNPLEVLEAAEMLGIDIDIHVDDKKDKNIESERNLGKMSLLSKARRKVLGFF